MPGVSKPTSVSTKIQQIADLARANPRMRIHSLSHHIDADWLVEAHRLTRKDGAVGVDGVSAKAYGENLEANLADLLTRFKSGTYQAPPVRRVLIPKDDGRERPIGIPTFEDKVLQRAVVMALEAVYEQNFYDCSYGFRPRRSAHQALGALRDGLMAMRGGFVLELDIASFFDTVDRTHLRAILDERIGDGVLRRTIDKWLAAGVSQNGQHERPRHGTPQGGVISPVLANVFLHVVLDRWFACDVLPRMRERAFMVRFADDAVLAFSDAKDAARVMAVLHQRFARFGLTLHATKTRLVAFRRPARTSPVRRPTFDFLGFTHYWTVSRAGKTVIKHRTARGRFRRSLARAHTWCRTHRHLRLADQHAHLCALIRGHMAYFGITGNIRLVGRFVHAVCRVWRYWLDRRSQHARMSWPRFTCLLRRYPPPRIHVRPLQPA